VVAGVALRKIEVGVEFASTDLSNPGAVCGSYIDRAAISFMNLLTPKWQDGLAAYNVSIWDQYNVLEQRLRID
jgi:hypothetical protein